VNFEQFAKSAANQTLTVGVVGLGYVGLPLVLTFSARGFRVIGFDVDDHKVDALMAGESYIRHISADDIDKLVKGERFLATTDYALISRCDAVLLCVPTPLNKHREPDMSFVVATTKAIAPHLRAGQLIVLESTTYPGTTGELMRPLLEEPSGLTAGEDFWLAYSPEREDPGNPNFDTSTIPKVVGGLTPTCTKLAVALYENALESVVPVSGLKVAELTKLLENIFRSVNIALVNELKVLCQRMDVDVWEVIDAAATKPFGFMPFYPGPGLGGHCIPIDPFYLTWKAREYGLSTRFIELAGEVNTAMPAYVIERVSEALNGHKKCLNGAQVMVLGIAYKNDVDDVRESPALEVIELLRERGAEVCYHDPFVARTHKMRFYDLGMESVPLTDEQLKSTDAVVITTAHTGVDYQRVVKLAPLVVDTRNATANLDIADGDVVKA